MQFKPLPISIPSCRRFTNRKDAEKHAVTTSRDDTETRHVIKTGDYWFSSTTAQIFWYEKLLLTFRNGQLVAANSKENYF